MKEIIPAAALAQHVAVLGKTGSGKTSTAKLAIEQVVANGARVCVLDPIKSDWWGLTSSADGKHAGLPFHILGGPRGHVPLHEKAGKAIAELVASGALPLSILDMADFPAGGLQHFFTDFAPVLIRKMQGVLYLVIEEAHEFAPKERSGFDKENLAIHFAKKLATAGRSKGIRMIVLSQRTQALHNALLGSCDTLIAHRFTAPADQEPVVKWLKSNLEPELAKKVAASLSSLKTGEGWLCAGEAKIFEQRQFPRIQTYDNTATPTGEDKAGEVKTAPVDVDKLRVILGTAVKDAEENDVKVLKTRLAHLEKFASTRPTEIHIVDDEALKRAEQQGYARGLEVGALEAAAELALIGGLEFTLTDALDHVRTVKDAVQRRKIRSAAPQGSGSSANAMPAGATSARSATEQRAARVPAPAGAATDSIDKPMPRAMLTALAQHPDGLTKGQILVHTGYRSSGPVSGCFAELARNGWTETSAGRLRITSAGLTALGAYDPLPIGASLREHLLSGNKCSTMEKAMLHVLFNAYPDEISKGAILESTGYASSGPVSAAFARLVALGYARQTGRGTLRAAEELFR